jgi:hypothetical protein
MINCMVRSGSKYSLLTMIDYEIRRKERDEFN